MPFPTNTLPFYAAWQDHIRTLKPESTAEMQLAMMLDGVESVFRTHPATPQTGYEGVLYQVWAFWQFFSGARGEFTPQGSVFFTGWRDVGRMRAVAGWIGATTLAERLAATEQALQAFTPEDLDRYDASFGRRPQIATSGTEPLDDPHLIKQISQLLEGDYGNQTMTGLSANGPALSGKLPDRTFDRAAEPVQTALIRLLDGLAQNDPTLVAQFGDPATTPAPKITAEPEDSHHPKAIEAMNVFGTPGLLTACGQMGLWLAEGYDMRSMMAIPVTDRPVSPCFFTTKSGQSLCVLGFLDGALLLDTESWTELARDMYTSASGKRGPNGHVPVADKPQVHFDRDTQVMTLKGWFKKPAKPLIYQG